MDSQAPSPMEDLDVDGPPKIDWDADSVSSSEDGGDNEEAVCFGAGEPIERQVHLEFRKSRF